jgi:hypothetical protein
MNLCPQTPIQNETSPKETKHENKTKPDQGFLSRTALQENAILTTTSLTNRTRFFQQSKVSGKTDYFLADK